MRLQYEVAVIGTEQLKRSLRGVEAQLSAHARQTQAITRRATGTTRPQKPSEVIRGIAGIGAVARAADLRASREQITAERRRHAEAMRHRAREAQAMAAGLASIGKAARADEMRRHREAMRNAARESATRARMVSRTAASVGRGAVGAVGRGVSNVAGIAGTTLAIGGGFAVAGAVQSQMGATAAASNLANQAGRPELKGRLLEQLQSQKGVTAEEAAGGASAFQALSGDIEATQRALPMLSQLALASGSNIEDLGAAAGSAFAQIRRDVSDPIEQMKRLADVMRLVAAQGQEGAIEIRDLGREMPRLAGVASKFVGDKDKNLGGMAAFAQIAVERGGAANAAQAVSGVEAMVRQLGARGTDLEKLGVKVFQKDSQGRRTGLLDPTDTVISALRATGGDIPKLQKIFGEEGMRGIEGLRSTFVQAGGGEEGEAAIRALFQRFGKTMTEGDVEKRAASRLSDPDLQFKEQVKNFNREVGSRLLPVVTSKLLPAMEKLAPHVATVADKLAEFASWFADNPVKGIGALIGASVAKDIAMAGVGKMASGAIERLVKSLMPKAPGTGGAGVPVPGAGVGGGAAPIGTPAVAGFRSPTAGARAAGALAVGVSMKGELDNMTPALLEQAKMDEERRHKEPWYESILRGVGKGSGSAVDVALFGGTKGKNVEAERVAEAASRAEDKALLAAAEAQNQAAQKLESAAQRLASVAVEQNRTTPVSQR